jgi:c-di-GMP-binding flagellar brake protein YcgR
MINTRRKSIRHHVKSEIHYKYNQKEIKCDLLDLSDSGCCLRIKQILDIEDEIIVALKNDIDIVWIRGIIKHHRPQFVGLKFIFDHAYQKAFLSDYIKTLYKNRKSK